MDRQCEQCNGTGTIERGNCVPETVSLCRDKKSGKRCGPTSCSNFFPNDVISLRVCEACNGEGRIYWIDELFEE